MPLIAHWIFLQLPSCGPGFESQANHLRYFSQILYYTCHCIEKRTKINKNMGLDIFKIKIQPYHNGTSFMCSFQSLQNPMTLELSWEKLHKIAVFYIKNISVKVILFRYLGIFESLNTSKKTSIPTPTRIPLQQLRVCLLWQACKWTLLSDQRALAYPLHASPLLHLWATKQIIITVGGINNWVAVVSNSFSLYFCNTTN